MIALKQRDAEAGLAFHQTSEARVYFDDEVQKPRIQRSREALQKSLGALKNCRIIELGCGTLDISGPFSVEHRVCGVECNLEAGRIACERWPGAILNNISLQPESCEALVLCEFLEHVADPFSIVRDWLPLAKTCVISHPLNGDLTDDLSGGEHQWSFDESDFANWFSLGGHRLIEHEVFKMGGYQIILGRGERVL
jgi:hypothetical protein